MVGRPRNVRRSRSKDEEIACTIGAVYCRVSVETKRRQPCPVASFVADVVSTIRLVAPTLASFVHKTRSTN
jgi:hypothetical protein